MNSRELVALLLGLALQVGCGDVIDPDGGVSGDGGSPPSLGPAPGLSLDGGLAVPSGPTPGVYIDGDQVGGGRVIIGNGARADLGVALGGFTRVSTDSALDVAVTQGNTFLVVVSVDSNLLAQVTTELRGDTLLLGTQGSFETKLPGPHIKVTLPQLVEANVTGSGDLSVATNERGPLTLGLSGSGDAHIEGSAQTLDVQSSGSGDCTIVGTALDVTIESTGSGEVDAEQLSATHAIVDSSGSGDVTITASGTALTSLSGSGDIDLYGNAQLQEGPHSGSGTVKQH